MLHISQLIPTDIPVHTIRIWLLEASKQLPKSSTLHGYDIDVSQSPAKKWLPPNVSNFTWDAFSDVPVAMAEKYDLVHIGIFFLLIANNDPVPILKNLIKLLSECVARSASVISVCV